MVSTSGAPNAVNLTITLQESIDLSKVLLTGVAVTNFGRTTVNDAGVATYAGGVGISSATVVNPGVDFAGTTYLAPSAINSTVPMVFGAGDKVTCRFTVPIVGLSSSVQVSSNGDTRVVAATARNSGVTQAVTAGVTNVNFAAIQGDTHGGFNGTGSIYTVQSAGNYQVSFTTRNSGGGTAMVYLNGASYFAGNSDSPTNLFKAGSGILFNLKAGDQISIREGLSGTIAADNGQIFSVSRISGPQAIAASESVNAGYSTAAGQSIPTSVNTPVLYGTKGWDSHNAYNTATGIYTAPTAGKYHIDAMVEYAAHNPASGTYVMVIYKNGVVHKSGAKVTGFNVIQQWGCAISCDVSLLQGETIQILTYQITGASRTLAANTEYNFFNIARIGN